MLSQVSRRTQKLDLVLLKLGCRGVAVGQAMLVSATLSEEVEQLKAELMMAQAFPFMLQDSGSLQKVQKLPIFFVLKWNFPHLARLLQKTWYLIIFFSELVCACEEVYLWQGLMLHKPVVLKLEEPRVTGKLSQHCRHVLTSTIGGLKYMCASDWFALGFTGLPFLP